MGWLANVLESLSLAYVQSSRQGSLAPLEAYMRLRDLGTAGPDSASTFSYFTYKSIGAELREWVDHGSISPTPIGVVKVSAGADPPVGTAGRAEAVSSVLRRAIQEHERSYNELEQEWAARPATLSHAPLWAGAWREMRQALEQIDQAVVDHQKRSATRDVLH